MHIDAHELVEGVVFEFEETGHRHECRVVDNDAEIQVRGGIRECAPELRAREVHHENPDLDAVIVAQPVSDRLKCVRATRDEEEMHAASGELGRESSAKTLGSSCDHGPVAVARWKVSHMSLFLVNRQSA